MRTTQLIGLSNRAKQWLIDNVQVYPLHECPCGCGVSIPKHPASKDSSKFVTGMFGEKVYVLKEYTTNSNHDVIEYIQCDVWSNGPCVFLALADKSTNKIIEESLWAPSEIDEMI